MFHVCFFVQKIYFKKKNFLKNFYHADELRVCFAPESNPPISATIFFLHYIVGGLGGINDELQYMSWDMAERIL